MSNYGKLQDVYLKWHQGRRPLSGFIRGVQDVFVAELQALPKLPLEAELIISDYIEGLLGTSGSDLAASNSKPARTHTKSAPQLNQSNHSKPHDHDFYFMKVHNCTCAGGG